MAADRAAQPTAGILDSRTLQSSPESGSRTGYDGYKRRQESEVHAAVDTLVEQAGQGRELAADGRRGVAAAFRISR